MSTDRDTTRIVRSWLRTDEHESADRVLDAVLDRLDTTPQRRASWLARRFSAMNPTMRITLAAAAVVVAALIGFSYFGSQSVGSPGLDATPDPTPAAQQLPATGDLDPGTYLISETDGTLRPFTVTVPAGWHTAEGFVSKGHPDTVMGDAAGDVFLVSWIPTHFYADSCQHAGTVAEAMVEARTPEAMVDALSRQGGHETTGPEGTRLGGYTAQRLDFHVPSDVDIASCDDQFLRLWPGPAPVGVDPDTSSGLPIFIGQTVTVYVVDIDGEPIVVAAAAMADATATDIAEMEEVVASIQFAASDGETVVRRWVDALNQGDADLMTSLMAEDVNTGDGALARAEAVRSVLDTWCPITIDAIERVGDSYLVGATYRDDEGSTCTAGAPGTTGTFVLEIREGKVTRMP